MTILNHGISNFQIFCIWFCLWKMIVSKSHEILFLDLISDPTQFAFHQQQNLTEELIIPKVASVNSAVRIDFGRNKKDGGNLAKSQNHRKVIWLCLGIIACLLMFALCQIGHFTWISLPLAGKPRAVFFLFFLFHFCAPLHPPKETALMNISVCS